MPRPFFFINGYFEYIKNLSKVFIKKSNPVSFSKITIKPFFLLLIIIISITKRKKNHSKNSHGLFFVRLFHCSRFFIQMKANIKFKLLNLFYYYYYLSTSYIVYKNDIQTLIRKTPCQKDD